MNTTVVSPSNANAVPTELWQTALQTLQPRFTRPVFEMWIRPMQAVAIEGDELLLSARNAFARSWVERHLKDDLTTGIAEAFGSPLRLAFTVSDAPASSNNAPLATETNVTTHTAHLKPEYAFDDFVTGSNNRFAHAGAMAVASAPGRAYNPLFVYGESGLGKTHLLHAIGQRVQSENPQAVVLYVTCERFANEFTQALRNNTIAEFRNRYREADVLLLDDVQFLGNHEQIHEELFHTCDALIGAGRQVVIACDRQPGAITTLEPRLRSRFEGGLVADIGRPDLETRDAIVRRKAEHAGVTVPTDVSAFIAQVVTSNVRELEGALTRVIASASLAKTAITIELAQDVLKHLRGVGAARRIAVTQIKETVAQAYGLTVKELDNGRRDQRLAGPRQIAMYVTTELTNNSLPQIAREFGKKDHTTIMYARDKIKGRMSNDERFRGEVRHLIALCQTTAA